MVDNGSWMGDGTSKGRGIVGLAHGPAALLPNHEYTFDKKL